MKFLTFLLLALSGCRAPSWGGYVSLPVGHTVAESLPGSGKTIEVVRLKYGPTWTYRDFLDIGVHPTVTLITDNTTGGPGVGGEMLIRPRYDAGWAEPYVSLTLGAEWYMDRIKGQGTDWGFPLSAGLGVRFAVGEKSWLTAEVSLWHESNGTKVFGHGGHPNPGWNSDILTIGFEKRF